MTSKTGEACNLLAALSVLPSLPNPNRSYRRPRESQSSRAVMDVASEYQVTMDRRKRTESEQHWLPTPL